MQWFWCKVFKFQEGRHCQNLLLSVLPPHICYGLGEVVFFSSVWAVDLLNIAFLSRFDVCTWWECLPLAVCLFFSVWLWCVRCPVALAEHVCLSLILPSLSSSTFQVWKGLTLNIYIYIYIYMPAVCVVVLPTGVFVPFLSSLFSTKMMFCHLLSRCGQLFQSFTPFLERKEDQFT